MRASTAARQRVLDRHLVPVMCLASWLVPGAGHFWLRRAQKGVVFLVLLPLMFVIGLGLQGRIFPFEPSQPLVALAALADLGIGMPYFVAWALRFGHGNVVAATYEYGNTFLIAAGLLNVLVVLDAYDIAAGRKWRGVDLPMAIHLVLLIVFAVLTSAVFAMLQRDTRPDQVRLFVLLVAGFVGAPGSAAAARASSTTATSTSSRSTTRTTTTTATRPTAATGNCSACIVTTTSTSATSRSRAR